MCIRDRNKIKPPENASYSQVYVMADSIENVAEIEATLKTMGVSYWSLSSQREEMQKSTRTIQMILGGLAGISLLVAALGITNTMIMSIYERTREIGIMKVLGCAVAVSYTHLSFLSDIDVMGMTFLKSCTGNFYELSFFVHFLNVMTATVTHTGTETA